MGKIIKSRGKTEKSYDKVGKCYGKTETVYSKTRKSCAKKVEMCNETVKFYDKTEKINVMVGNIYNKASEIKYLNFMVKQETRKQVCKRILYLFGIYGVLKLSSSADKIKVSV